MKKTTVETLDDLDGSPAQHSVRLTLDDTTYLIDLSTEHHSELLTALAPYLAAARVVGRQRTPSTRKLTPTNREEARRIRTWAADNGYAVPARGPIPHDIRRAYDATDHP